MTTYREAEFTVIFCEKAMFVTKCAYPNWQAIQAEYRTYKASLNPDTLDNLVEYLEFDYGKSPTSPGWKELLQDLASGTNDTIEISDAFLKGLKR